MQYLKFGFPLKVINSIYDWCIIYPHFVNQKINYQNVTAIEMSTKQPKTTSYLWKCPVSRPQTPRLRNFVRFHGFVGFIMILEKMRSCLWKLELEFWALAWLICLLGPSGPNVVSGPQNPRSRKLWVNCQKIAKKILKKSFWCHFR